MAPQKRTQAVSEEEEDEISSNSNATPVMAPHYLLLMICVCWLDISLILIQNKRRRTSDSASVSGSSHGSDGSEHREREETELPWQTPEVNLEDEDTLEQQQTQFIRENYHGDEPNIPADHGIIERVDCFNFMCHKHFSVELGPLINFIVGKNGSGKSAILTALTLCLGGKASVTNRGQSLKSFIKEGEE